MKYKCGHCDEYHEIGDLTINIGDEGYKLIDDIDTAVMDIIEKRRVPLELLIYALAAHLEEIKQTGLQLGNKSDRIEMIIQVARNDVINEEGEEKRNELLAGSRVMTMSSLKTVTAEEIIPLDLHFSQCH
jgi:hypothetical protein